MKIYVVAHENIVCPKEYRKIEITEEDVEGYIKRSGYIAKCKNFITNVITILEILI